MPITYTDKDIFDEEVLEAHDVFIHSQNCFNTWGAGLAVRCAKVFPELYKKDLGTIRGDRSKLGTFISVEVDRSWYTLNTVAVYGQYNYGKFEWGCENDPLSSQVIRYKALYDALSAVYRKYGMVRYLMPKLGSGLAAGEWMVIAAIIEDVFKSCPITVSLYNPRKPKSARRSKL